MNGLGYTPICSSAMSKTNTFALSRDYCAFLGISAYIV